jgi:hypothetical protein
MTAHSRPVDKPKVAKKRAPKKVNGRTPGLQPSRTAINPAAVWPFPGWDKK